jgi:Spy/CpxP family protein refolding chaperone
MQYRANLAMLLLSTALITAPVMTTAAYAHDGGDQGSCMHCEHEHLSEAKKELLHTTFKKLHESNKAVFEELHKLHKERHDILVAKTFNKAAYLSVTTKIDEKRAELEKSRAEAFASIADKFTPEERERLGHMMGHHHHHGGWRHAGWKHGEGHEGWHHHDGQNDGMSDKAPAAPESNPESAAPGAAQ